MKADKLVSLVCEGDLEWLTAHVSQLPKGAVILEFGSFLMGSAVAMAAANPEACVYAVDPGHLHWLVADHPTTQYLTQRYPQFEFNPESAAIIRQAQLALAPNLQWEITFSDLFVPPAAPQFCFIDADHSYEAVLKDFWHCWQMAAPNAVIAGHDFILPSVQKAVAEIAQILQIQPVKPTEQIWYWQKSLTQ